MSEPRDELERRFAQRYADYLGDGVGEMDTKKVRRLETPQVARCSQET